jgi:hypothetical protein
MVRHVSKILDVRHPEVVPKVTHDTPRVASETLALNLFDIDPYTEPERPKRLDLNLDQLEDDEE